MKNQAITLTDDKTLVSATSRFGHAIPVYDDGYGPLWIHRDSMGISGIVRAQTWEDAYSICEDEFFPTADDAEAEGLRIQAMADGPEKNHEQACWDEAYGFRPNGRGGPTPDRDVGLYAKDLNGDSLDPLTEKLRSDLGIVLTIADC